MLIENLQEKGNRRDRILILSDMLLYALKGISRTELMCKAGLSSAQIKKFTPVLVKSELIEISLNERRLVYKTTDKGKSFLERSSILRKLLGW